MMNNQTQNIAGLPWLAAIAFFMQSLDNTILNTAIPTIAEYLNTTPVAMRMAIISYTLTVALLIPVSGWIADRFGTKHVFIMAVFVFTLGSLFCALSTSLPILIIARIIQAIGGAMMMPVSRLAILRAYPRGQLIRIMNFVAIPGLIGPIIGPILSGWLVTYASWHWIFLINIPIGIIGLVYAFKFMPNFTMPANKFDTLGFLLFGFSLVLMSVGLTLTGEHVVNTYIIITVIFSSIILMLFYILHASHFDTPLIRLSLFNNRVYSIGIIGGLLTRLGIGCIPFLLPLMLQVGFHLPAFTAGLMMIPLAVGSITAKYFVPKVLNHLGYKTTLLMTTLFTGLIIAAYSLQQQNTMLLLLCIPLFINGVLTSIHFTSINTLTLGSLTNKYASEGNSIMSVIQQLSVSFGIAISASVYNLFSSMNGGSLIDHFHYTFLVMGSLTFLSAVTFYKLNKSDGQELLSHH